MVALSNASIDPSVMQPSPPPITIPYGYRGSRAAQLCQVVLHWDKGDGEARNDASVYIVTISDLDALLEACIEAHYDAEVPIGHSASHASQVAYITMSRMRTRIYSVPSREGQSDGVVTWGFSKPETLVWIRPGLKLSSNTYCVFASALDRVSV